MSTVKFAGQTINVRSKEVLPSRMKCNDLVMVKGAMLKLVTVQHGCPIWESNTRTDSVYLFETESGAKVPVRNLAGKFTVMRKSR